MNYLDALDSTVQAYANYLVKDDITRNGVEALVLSSVILGVRLHQRAPGLCFHALRALDSLAAKRGTVNAPDAAALLLANAVREYLRTRPAVWSSADMAAVLARMGESDDE